MWLANSMEIKFLNLIFSFRGEGFIGICVRWCDSIYFIVNIYSSYFMANKRKLWKGLCEFK